MVLENDPEALKGSKQYLGQFQKILSVFMDSMSTECRAEMEEEQQKWAKEGPPPELRVK